MEWDDQNSMERTDTLREAMLELTQAAFIMNTALAELAAHTDEHHKVINELGGAVSLLEGLLIGTEGSDEPTA